MSELHDPIECPECGGRGHVRRGFGARRSSLDERIRQRICDDCGHVWRTVEIVTFRSSRKGNRSAKIVAARKEAIEALARSE